MKTKAIVIALLGIAMSSEALADNSTDKELAVDQKLKQVYQLYRINETVSLNPHEVRLGMGLSYTTDEFQTFDVRQSSRHVGAQASAAYGINQYFEVGLSVPVGWSSSSVESATSRLFEQTNAGLEPITARVVGTLPIAGFETNGILSVQIPTGNSKLGNQDVYSTLGFNIARNMRPAFVYGGLSWKHAWESQRNAVGYNAGFGFYLNHALSLGAAFTGTTYLDPLPGNPKDMGVATVNMAYQITPSIGITPSVSFGVTQSAPDFSLALGVFWRM